MADLASGFDTVMVSLSKGLCAPVGSVLAGSTGLIEEARRIRKLLGGGMRQAGVVAAAGRVAIAQMGRPVQPWRGKGAIKPLPPGTACAAHAA